MKACAGCGVALPPPRKHGRERKWCSDRCRKGQYAGTCQTCGAATNGYDGPGTAPDRCGECWRIEHTQWERNEKLIEMWEEGVPASEIASRLGISVTYLLSFVVREREKGFPLSRRQLPKSDSASRYRLIGRLVRQGFTNEQIGAELGTSGASVGMMIASARKKGFDVPLRKELAA